MRTPHALLALLALSAAPLVAQVPQGRTGAALARAEVKEWEVPYGARTRPRDPYADVQGRVWFVGQVGNYVAYLDSRSGEFKRYEIDPGTNPHNLVVEKGMVWMTGNRNGKLVKLDPKTGAITSYQIPDSTVRDPHTMVFDEKGIAWFTAQNSNAIGRFDPATGQFRLWKTGERTRPYGIEIDGKGQPWVVLFGTNRLATIDPASLQLRTIALPNDSTRPRRIAVMPNGDVYWGDYTRGMLGRMDARTGAFEEWALPLGRISMPYAMAKDDRDRVWVAQNGSRGTPATLVAFDTKAKRFVAEAVAGAPDANTIRHMTFDPATRKIWFGTDQGAVGHIVVPR